MMQLLQPLSNNEPTLIIRLCEILEFTWSRTFSILVFFCFHLQSIFLLTAVNQFFFSCFIFEQNQPDSIVLSGEQNMKSTWFTYSVCRCDPPNTDLIPFVSLQILKKTSLKYKFSSLQIKLKLSLIVLFPLKSLIYTQPSPVCICQI